MKIFVKVLTVSKTWVCISFWSEIDSTNSWTGWYDLARISGHFWLENMGPVVLMLEKDSSTRWFVEWNLEIEIDNNQRQTQQSYDLFWQNFRMCGTNKSINAQPLICKQPDRQNLFFLLGLKYNLRTCFVSKKSLFGRSVNPIQTEGSRLCPTHYYLTPYSLKLCCSLFI